MDDPTPTSPDPHDPRTPPGGPVPAPPAGTARPEGEDRPGPRRPFTWLAWTVIVALCALAAFGQAARREATGGPDTIGLMLMRLQSQYFVYAATLQGPSELLYSQAEQTLNIGSVAQRLRFVPVAGELRGPQTALQSLAELRELIAEQDDDAADEPSVQLSEVQARSADLLEQLYAGLEQSDGIVLTEPQQQTLIDELGWFGRLALAPPDVADDKERRAVLAPGQRLLVLFVAALVILGAGGLAGFVGLVILIVLALLGRLGPGLAPTPVRHGVYAETFALWLTLFIGLQLAGALVGRLVGGGELILGLSSFFLSLAALGWPVLRGVPWAQVRRDIGLHGGRTPALEPIIGVGAYFMGLPLLAIGVVATFLLLLLQQALSGPGPVFGPSGGPAHPIVEQLGGPDWWPKIQVLVLAAVAAPVIEETMFRGVLYRHLREATRWMATVGSVLASALLSGFLFAIIHPQGWVAVPALMSLAFAFTLAREWRGTLVVPIVMHGVSNGLVMALLIAALTISRSG